MGNSTKRCVPVENRLLAALPKKEYQRLLPELEPVTLAFAEVLYEPDQHIRHVYFSNSGMIPLVSTINERSTTAVNIVGNDGMVGIQIFLGMNFSPNRAIVLVGGTALRMKASVLRRESQNGALERLLRRYTQTLLLQSQQETICNHFHKIDERLCCWLLLIHDAAGSKEFPMTQKLLSNMMGVRREEVSKAANPLQQDKLISYSRGHVKILNLARLKEITCECYRISKSRNK